LVDGVPRTLNLKQILQRYIDHQVDVVTRRARFDLRKAEERDHIVQGLLIALANIDEVIRIIRAAADADEARTKLMAKFKLSEIQANYILDMPLRRLTKLERLKLDDIISQVFTTTTHHWLLVFTNKGKVYRTKVHEVSESSRQSRGTYVANLPGMGFGGDERIAAVIDTKDYEKGKFLVFATKKGMVKKTALP